jgi:hypothetical protein
MAFRATPFFTASVLLVTGLLVALACNNSNDAQLGNIGQDCFEAPDGSLSCDPGLTCVPIPGDSGGFEGGECFDLDAGEESTAPDADAAEDVADAASDAPTDSTDGGSVADAKAE